MPPRTSPSPAQMLGFRSGPPTGGLNLLQLMAAQPKPLPGTKEHYKQMQMLANAWKPQSAATFLFGFE